jgi:hypothetical protein
MATHEPTQVKVATQSVKFTMTEVREAAMRLVDSHMAVNSRRKNSQHTSIVKLRFRKMTQQNL